MAGIYIHIPFCRRACHYCNFHFSTSLKLQNDFLEALLKELRLRRDYLQGQPVDTIYFGGGTPSLLSPTQLAAIMSAIDEHFTVSSNAEITLEANPDDISALNVDGWRTVGVNRLSIGVQSFFDADLRWMNRAHNAAHAENALLLAQTGGIENISVDLIYGTPGLSNDQWMENMQRVVALGIPHLSCYALTVEAGTALWSMIEKNRTPAVNTDQQAEQFLIMSDFLTSQGYEHYEISNFAIPGKRSAHNSAYWNGRHYLGLGPSAHSFNGESRQWNVANNALYIQALANGELSFEREVLTGTQRFNEYVMTSLRKSEGLDKHYMRAAFGDTAVATSLKLSQPFVSRGWIEEDDNRIWLTRQGKLFADGIASDLFLSQTSNDSILRKASAG